MASALEGFPENANSNPDRAPIATDDGMPPAADTRSRTVHKAREPSNRTDTWQGQELLDLGMIVECGGNNTVQSELPWNGTQPSNVDFSTSTGYSVPHQGAHQRIPHESGIYTMGDIPTTGTMSYIDLSGDYTYAQFDGNNDSYQLGSELLGAVSSAGLAPGFAGPFDDSIVTTGLDMGTYYAMDASGALPTTVVDSSLYAFSQPQLFDQSVPVSMSYHLQDATAQSWQATNIMAMELLPSQTADPQRQSDSRSTTSRTVPEKEGTSLAPPPQNEPSQKKRPGQGEKGLEFSAYDPSVKDCRRKRKTQTSCKPQLKTESQVTSSKTKIPGLAVFRVKREPKPEAVPAPTNTQKEVPMLMGPPTHQYQRLPMKMSVMDNQGSVIVLKDFQAPVKRKALDLVRREELKKTRMLGVCWACKFTKTRCSWEGTCSTCVKLATFYSQDPLIADLKNLQCIRSSLTEIRFDNQDFKTNRIMLDFMRLAMKEIDGSTTGFAFSSFGLNRVYGLQADTELHNYLTDTSPWDLTDPGRTLVRRRNKEFWFSSFLLHENNLLQFLEHERFVKNNTLVNCPITQNLFEDCFYFYSLITLFESILYRKFFDPDLQTLLPRILVGVSMYDKRTNTRQLALQSYIIKPSAASLADQLSFSPESKTIHSGGITHFRRMAKTVGYVGALYSRQAPTFGKALGWNFVENSTVVEANVLHTLYVCESSTLVSEDNELACLAAGRVHLTFKSDMEGKYLFTRGG